MRFFRRFKRCDGFSLAEMMIAVAIVVVVGIVIILFSMTAQRDIGRLTDRTTSLQNARISMEYLKRDIIAAREVVDSYAASYHTGDSEIVLALYPVSGDVVHRCATDVTHLDHIIYRIVTVGDSSDLERIVIPNTAEIATDRVVESRKVGLEIDIGADVDGDGDTNDIFFYEGEGLEAVINQIDGRVVGKTLSDVRYIQVRLVMKSRLEWDDTSAPRQLVEMDIQCYFRNN